LADSLYRILGRLVAAVISVILLFTIVLVVAQRKLIFLPPFSIENATPADYQVPFEELTIKSSDGVDLAAWWIEQKPTNTAPDTRRPVLLYSHGNGATLPQLAHVAKLFYDLDLDVLLYDYRNYGRSARSKDGLSEDAIALDALAAREFIDQRAPGRPVIYWGHSLGSSVAARLAATRPPDGLVLEGAFTSMFGMARERYPWLPIFPFMVFDKFATSEYLSDYTAPLLVMHSEFDSIIPLRQGEAVFRAASSPKSFVLLKGIDHVDFPSVVQDYVEVLNEFREQVLVHWRGVNRGP